MFRNARLDDVVWSNIYGYGYISEFDQATGGMIVRYTHTRSDTSFDVSATLEGKASNSSRYSHVFWNKFVPPADALTPPRYTAWRWLYQDPKGVYHVTVNCYVDRAAVRHELPDTYTIISKLTQLSVVLDRFVDDQNVNVMAKKG